jgi:CheY-like chemotaxis protein
MKLPITAVLYVDDDQEDQEVFQEVLSKIQPALRCYLASSGNEAFHILWSLDEMPAAIYLDMNMPIQNGLEVLKALKSEARFSAIPTFVLTTSKSSQDIATANALGAAGYFVKPTSLTDVEELLRPLICAR